MPNKKKEIDGTVFTFFDRELRSESGPKKGKVVVVVVVVVLLLGHFRNLGKNGQESSRINKNRQELTRIDKN